MNVRIEYPACGREAPVEAHAADVEPTCGACGASLAVAHAIALDARAGGVLDRLLKPQPAGPLRNGG